MDWSGKDYDRDKESIVFHMLRAGQGLEVLIEASVLYVFNMLTGIPDYFPLVVRHFFPLI